MIYSGDMVSFFDPSVDAILLKVREQLENVGGNVDVRFPCHYCIHVLPDLANQFIILTGGFGGNPYLKCKLQDSFEAECRVVASGDLAT